jgi:hypothetical protein
MSADFNVICGLYEAEAASQKDTSVDCNGDKNDDGPVNAGADQVGELKGDGVESESKTGVRDDQENIQARVLLLFLYFFIRILYSLIEITMVS